jgi:hypothetical protein
MTAPMTNVQPLYLSFGRSHQTSRLKLPYWAKQFELALIPALFQGEKVSAQRRTISSADF